MKVRFYIPLLIIVSVMAFIVVMPVVFSRAQQDSQINTQTQLAVPPIDPAAEILYTKRVPHPICPNCFKITEAASYGIYEEVPGTGTIYLRDLPDPAPLKLGEERPEFDELGQPIWYIGHQGFVGPTDEEPVFPDLPYSKIELMRMKARTEGKVFSIRGVNGFRIGDPGFVVMLDPKYGENESFIPKEIEGVLVGVESISAHSLTSHFGQRYRPVPIGVSIDTPYPLGGGTLGPHIVRGNTPGVPCRQIWSLTAGHVVKDPAVVPLIPESPGSRVFQPAGSGFGWGYVVVSFQNLRCDTPQDPNCDSPAAPVNISFIRPDAAAIAHIDVGHMDSTPPT